MYNDTKKKLLIDSKLSVTMKIYLPYANIPYLEYSGVTFAYLACDHEYIIEICVFLSKHKCKFFIQRVTQKKLIMSISNKHIFEL